METDGVLCQVRTEYLYILHIHQNSSPCSEDQRQTFPNYAFHY